MKINAFTTPAEVNEDDLRGEPVVIIDVLRSNSTILQALENGCKEVIPVESIERALALHSALFDSDVLLCGERECQRIHGFDLGNSPQEFTSDLIAKKSLIFATTNGTVAMVKARKGKVVILCGFQNMETISSHISSGEFAKSAWQNPDNREEKLTILCSGQKNHFSLEDMVCTGMLITRITGRLGPDDPGIELTDAARSAVVLYKHHANKLKKMISQVDQGRELIRLGMEKDLDFCIQVDTLQVIPVYSDGKILKIN